MPGDVIRGPWPGSGEPTTPAPTHPAGKGRPKSADDAEAAKAYPFRWLVRERLHPSAVEARRAQILQLKPRCSVCDVPFSPVAPPPPDGVCRACKRDIDRNGPDDDQGGLF